MQASLLSALMDMVTISNIIWTQFFHNNHRFKHVFSSMQLPCLWTLSKVAQTRCKNKPFLLDDHLKAFVCINLLCE